VGSSSTIKWGNSRLRVALVLDNTGSMSSNNKMSALKTATNSLLTQLHTAATTNGDVYVSIVPFVKDVNVDAANWNATWVDWAAWDEVNGQCSKGQYTRQSTCTGAGKTWTTNNITPGMVASRIVATRVPQIPAITTPT